ncbi:MAG: hypothetical protein J6B45_03600 [Clostridia bacterium]|nr:hypothetical protein [Clostridia bacterium]
MITAVGLIIMVVSVILYVSLMTLVFPKHILKVGYKVSGACDRGVRKCLYRGKHCMVYDSSKENKPIIKQYLLLQEDGFKTLKCKVTPNVEYLDYDVALFNRYNKVFKVINVKEDIVGVELTRSVRLPDETAYVRIIIRRVNRTDMKKKPIVKITGGSIFAFSLVSVLFTAVEALVVRACCSYSFGEVFRESFIASEKGLIAVGVLALAMGLLGAISVVISSAKRARR